MTSKHRARPRSIAPILSGALLAAVCAAPAAAGNDRREASATATRYDRCGYTTSPYGRLGIYVIKGDVSCSEAERLIHRAFHMAGEPTRYGDSERYLGNWICGGQMGYYTCSRPTPAHPKAQVEGRACTMRGVGCPAAAGRKSRCVEPWRLTPATLRRRRRGRLQPSRLCRRRA
jgi:hypothetical protein